MGVMETKEFKRGYVESHTNVKNAKVISGMYARSKEMSDHFGKSLPLTEKGYVIGVADRLMDSWKGYALKGAELYKSTGVLELERVKKDVVRKLAKDVFKTKNAEYLDKARSFIKTNGLEGYVNSLGFNYDVADLGKGMIKVVPVLLAALWIVISGFRITGAVTGSFGISSFLGTGIFLLGVVWAVIYVEGRKK